jgi:hypothetical protein
VCTMHRQVFCVYNLNLSLWGPSDQLTISGMLLVNHCVGLNVELKFTQYVGEVERKTETIESHDLAPIRTRTSHCTPFQT